MRDALLLLATCGIAALGFASIAFSQRRHWPLLRLSGRARPPAWLRPAGWILLGLATIPALIRDGLAFGLLVWAVMLTVSALIVVGAITRLNGGTARPEVQDRDM